MFPALKCRAIFMTSRWDVRTRENTRERVSLKSGNVFTMDDGNSKLSRFSEIEPQSSIDVNTFKREQGTLAGETQTKTTNAGARDDAMTGNDDGDRITSDSATDGP